MAKTKISEKIEEMLGGFLEENGLELYNVEFVKEGKEWYLRVYIEKPVSEDGEEEQYIDTDDCELVSRYLSERLDEEDPIEQNYYLEVSSPGMDRALIKEADFKRFAGKPIDVSLYSAFDGKKTFTEATLIGIEGSMKEGKLIIEDAPVIPSKNKGAKPKRSEAVRYEIPFEQVSKVKLSVIF